MDVKWVREALNESVKKGKLVIIILNVVLRSWKMIYADVKAIVKQKEVKELVTVSYKFVRSIVKWGN